MNTINTRTAYVVLDQIENWGIGWTREAAIAAAAEWLNDPETDMQGTTSSAVEVMIEQGSAGLGVEKITIPADTDLSLADNTEILRLREWSEDNA